MLQTIGEEFIDREFVDEITLQINIVDTATLSGKESTASSERICFANLLLISY